MGRALEMPKAKAAEEFSAVEVEGFDWAPIPINLPLPGGYESIPAGGKLTTPNTAGYQFLQARALILLETEIGLVAVLPIGMAQVSSVVLSVKEGDVLKKGDEISYFQFGGSDCVMVFQKEANVQISAEKGTHYNFGNQIGTAQRVPK